MDLSVFDLDGTLTKYGFDLWMLTTEQLVNQPEAFQAAIAQYLANKHQETAYHTENSLVMMQQAIALMPDSPSDLIRQTAREITLLHQQQDDFIYQGAIAHIRSLLEQRKQVVISSANYLEGVEGFLLALVDLDLLTQSEVEQVTVHATLVDWHSKEVKHLNVGVGKVAQLNFDGSQSLHVIGDDIVVNDRALMDIENAKVWVVQNHKHQNVELPAGWQFINW